MNCELKLGFDKVCGQIAELCTTRRGRELFIEEKFSCSHEEIIWRHSICEEVRSALMMENEFPKEEFVEFGDIAVRLSVVGVFLEPEELIVLRNGLVSVGGVVGFFEKREQYPLMREFMDGISDFPEIVNHINTIIDRFGKVKDNASAELYSLRKTIRDREGQVSKKLQSILSSAIKAGYTDPEATVSMRDGRAVIPVLAVNKRKVAGFIHDESATGKTFFLEPVEIVEINNELKELEYAARREVIKILSEFTDSIRPESEAIGRSGEWLASVDMIRAKARWAIRNACAMPIVSLDGRLELRSARHPLLEQTLKKEKKEIVPLDIKLDPKNKIVVISGPNAGGKSVCLKTVGLLQYMFQSGIPIPALANSELPIFDKIFIDIGDQQSIENDLSTYSSHLLNMKIMLSGATDKSLVLIDEFGSGTEPVIGGAIAESILERFVECGTYGVITTHYTNIKYFASSNNGVANGAMMFDIQNIRPLFRLEIGEPGSSFAIEIARKIGLSEAIIKSASQKAGSDVINLERQLRDVARSRNYWEQKRERIRLTDKHVEELESEYANRLTNLKEERNVIIRQAKEDAREMLDSANRTIENTVRIIKESQADKETTRMARREFEATKEFIESGKDYLSEERDRVEREMQRVERRQQRRDERKELRGEKVERPKPEVVKRVVEVGAKVRIVGQDSVGEVMSVKGKKATIAMGQMLTNLPIDRLEVISNAEYKKETRPVSARTVVSVDISSRKLNFKDTIDIRGMRAAEALEQVQDFIDDAIMVGVENITILHGKGTGALKEEIRRYLETIREIATASDAHADRGGAGITVVEFK